MTRQYVQRLVAELAAADLVAVSGDARDRRSKTVRLTVGGQLLLEELAPAERALIADLAAGHAPGTLDMARDVLAELLGRLEEGLVGDRQRRPRAATAASPLA